jgi:capsular exopolysaccharide synthesis family protein
MCDWSSDVCSSDLGSLAAQRPPRPFSLRLLLRFKWTILLVFVVLAPLGVVLVRAVFVPEYTATALVEIFSVVPRLVVETDETGPITQYERYVQTQADIMRSQPVLQRVLERKDVQQTAWFDEPPSLIDTWTGNTPQRIERLAKAAEAMPRKRTELLELSVTTRTPADSALLANALLDEYLRFARERFSEKDRALFDALNDEQKKVAAEIGFLEQVVAETRRELLSPSPDDLIAQRRIRLDQYEADLRRLELDMDVARQELGELEVGSSQPSEAAAPAARYQADAEWRRLYGQWKDTEQRLNTASMQFGESHPTMVRLQQALESAQTALEARQRELEEGAVAGLAAAASSGTAPGVSDPLTLRHQLRAWELRRQRLEREVRELRQSFESDFSAAERLRQKTDELQHNKERYQAVVRRLEELAEKTKVPASIRTISRAVAPSAPKDIKRLKLSIAAVIGALAAGLAAAYLRLRFSPRVEEAGDVGRVVPAAFLWELPLEFDSSRERPAESPEYAEGVRMMRTALLNRLDRGRGNTVQVTSAGPGSGKSTLAIHLARSLASCGKNTLLVEADLCRPGLAEHFGLDPARGLVNLLAERRRSSAGVYLTNLRGLSILPAGREADARHAELLANGDFSALLTEWRRSYDFIVFDSPPLLVTADAAILAGHADGTVMVVRERHCRRADLLAAYAKLSVAGGKLLGTAFIGSSLGRRYGYGYGYYRGHTAPDVKALPTADVPTPPRSDGPTTPSDGPGA